MKSELKSESGPIAEKEPLRELSPNQTAQTESEVKLETPKIEKDWITCFGDHFGVILLDTKI